MPGAADVERAGRLDATRQRSEPEKYARPVPASGFRPYGRRRRQLLATTFRACPVTVWRYAGTQWRGVSLRVRLVSTGGSSVPGRTVRHDRSCGARETSARWPVRSQPRIALPSRSRDTRTPRLCRSVERRQPVRVDLLQLLLPLAALTVVPLARATLIVVSGLISMLSRRPDRRKQAHQVLRHLLRRPTDGQ